MSVVSLQINVPVQIGVLDSDSDVITVSNTLVRAVDHSIDDFISDYELFVAGAVIPDVGKKMTTFAETVISNQVNSSIKIKQNSTITSVRIRVAENGNTNTINNALQSALGNLPDTQPEIVQIVLTFVLATAAIDTEDYFYDGKMNWTLAINYKRRDPISFINNIGGVSMIGK